MSIIQALLLGVLQGITEFLPVSSSGHLAIAENLFKINTSGGLLFETFLHLGTTLAVIIIYRKDFVNLITAFIRMVIDIIGNIRIFFADRKNGGSEPYNKIIDTAYKKFVVLIIVTCIPTAIIGLILSNVIEKASETLFVPGVCLLITAIILLLSERAPEGTKKVKKTGYKDALLIGVAQGFAAFPGISRSGTTITAGLMLGLDRSFAVKYSLLASLPAILGANLLELRHLGDAAGSAGAGAYICGFIAAAVVGYIFIRLVINLVKSNKFKYFAYYCAAVGIVCLIVYFVRG
ncbi:MAG: undecaprenyl-diphosphate phosphatase [Lachnospiraceae bacterium]|nr:undecaprenyl-diphosphate phosphatase [Lachnospiraceae bacterium]